MNVHVTALANRLKSIVVHQFSTVFLQHLLIHFIADTLREVVSKIDFFICMILITYLKGFQVNPFHKGSGSQVLSYNAVLELLPTPR